ncbi:MAG TPA: hypothetical protein IAB59_07195 [Candidatus Onthousia faecipullorum]|uniref:Uncharacterized protein n=1 Tax=Candidatus Onthousia faecipullorum TaxID=2840887 RepID=A0A9D1GCY2_9FIRM|nr:hypothetical protein [Candidatus Onthousia faecipullorum]
MKKRMVLRNWVKVALLILLGIIAVFVIAKLVYNSSDNFEKYAKMCDQEKGSICSYYEVRNYMLIND